MAERPAMMDQYRRIKARYRDAMLFFRLGDFYEMFFEDAREGSALLDLTLTQRQGQPMCGIPYHAAKAYIGKLLAAGKKVAICEQLSAPGGKGIVERDVVEVVTPGTTIEEDFLDQGANNYLVCFCLQADRICVAWLDASTGEFRAYSQPGQDALAVVRMELYRLSPRELVVQQSLLELEGIGQALAEFENLMVERRPDWSFDARQAAESLAKRFGTASLKGFGFADGAPELAAAAELVRYLDEASKVRSPHVRSLLPYDRDEFLAVDDASRRNLELVRNLADSGRRDTLLAVLDHTRTAGGARLMRQWILQPLRKRADIEERLDAVEFIYRDQPLLGEARKALGAILDTERLAARVAMDRAHPRDLLALRDSLRGLAALFALLGDAGAPPLVSRGGTEAELEACARMSGLIDRGIRENPSILLTEGDIIRDGYDADLDALRALKKDSSALLEAYLVEERSSSGIANLRVRYNRIIGYYLEVTKGKLESVPSHFIRRQSLVTGERYTTVRLSEIEGELQGAAERIADIERRLFLEIRETLKAEIGPAMSLARSCAVADCVVAFAQAATLNGYCRPELDDRPVIEVRQGRHPVVEACLPPGAFVPNDLELDAEGRAFILLTGPNMAGKSTFLRQAALIVLMAHAGSFVPADSARIGLTDRIFCRVGAQDNLARGESTFLVEMHETAYILNTAGRGSLVIMDEVGRGTGTLDGLSIAWAVSERLLETVGCRTLFATHYHELTALAHPSLVNRSMAVLEDEGRIVFQKRVVEGPAAGSYGLHVARLAGVPEPVLLRAARIKDRLSQTERALPVDMEGTPVQPGPGSEAAGGKIPAATAAGGAVLAPGLFDTADLVLDRLRGLDPDRMTPIEALATLSGLRTDLLAGD